MSNTATNTDINGGKVQSHSEISRFYRPELDALRFFAFVGVFLYHRHPLDHIAIHNPTVLMLVRPIFDSLESSVSLFFFLSAYLITVLLELEIEGTGTLNVSSFYIRRSLRIWPLYYIVFGAAIVFGLLNPKFHVSFPAIVTYGLFVGNWLCALKGWDAVQPTFGPLWSVSVEEQYYLICPLVMRHLKRRGLAVLSLLSFVISYLVLLWFGHRSWAGDASLRANTFIQMQFFSAGTLTALILGRRVVALPWVARTALSVAGLGAWFASDVFFKQDSSMYLSSVFAPALSLLLILFGVLALFFAIQGLAASNIPKWTISLGKISYGLYAVHLFVITAINHIWPTTQDHGAVTLGVLVIKSLVIFGLSILIARTSYTFIEKPFLRLKDRFTFVKSRVA